MRACAALWHRGSRSSLPSLLGPPSHEDPRGSQPAVRYPKGSTLHDNHLRKSHPTGPSHSGALEKLGCSGRSDWHAPEYSPSRSVFYQSLDLLVAPSTVMLAKRPRTLQIISSAASYDVKDCLRMITQTGRVPRCLRSSLRGNIRLQSL
jgi:hypothetical protein